MPIKPRIHSTSSAAIDLRVGPVCCAPTGLFVTILRTIVGFKAGATDFSNSHTPIISHRARSFYKEQQCVG